VVLVRFQGVPQRLCCVKPQRMDAHGELCASILAGALDVRTASLQVVPTSCDILRALREAPLAITDHHVYIERMLTDAKYLGLVEFVNGPMMEGEEFVKMFEENGGTLARFWSEAGRLVAFDCLINNLDRLPIIWDNGGNLKNLMAEAVGNEIRVIGIDQAVRGIVSESGLDRYVEQLRGLLGCVLGSKGELSWLQSEYLSRLEASMQANFRGRFKVHARALQHGLQQAFCRTAWRWSSGSLQRSLDDALNKVMAVFDCTAETLWPLRKMIQSTAEVIADEVDRLQLHMVPRAVLHTFRRHIPSGQLMLRDLTLLLQTLAPNVGMDQSAELLSNLAVDSEGQVECSEFLALVWECGFFVAK